MKEGLISIIIPTFNRKDVLSETLDSILTQTYANWECIIVDDGSTDNSETLISEYIQKDNRFKFYKRPEEKQKGANACRNYGFEKSKGEFVNWFDSDDIMHPDFLKLRIQVLINEVSLDFCTCVYSTFTKDTDKSQLGIKAIKPLIFQSNNYIEDYLLHGLSFITDSVLWRKTFLNDKVLFDEYMFRAQECDFHLRMLTYCPQYKYLKEILFYLRRGNESITKESNTSFKAQKSIFKYFNNAFKIVEEKQPHNTEKIKQYIFYRQCVNFYTSSLLADGFMDRTKVMFNHAVNIFVYSFKSNTRFIVKLRLFLGMLLLLFFKKGYRLFYYPQFDYRSYT